MKRIALVGMLAAGGCTPLFGTSDIVDASEATVAHCDVVGEVNGSSVWGNYMGARNALDEARGQARGMGATHVVWWYGDTSFTSEIAGTAYRCAHGLTAPKAESASPSS